MNTPEGGKKVSETNTQRHGKDYYSKLGKLGGKAKVKKGLATLSSKRRKEIAKKGGIARQNKLRSMKEANEQTNS